MLCCLSWESVHIYIEPVCVPVHVLTEGTATYLLTAEAVCDSHNETGDETTKCLMSIPP